MNEKVGPGAQGSRAVGGFPAKDRHGAGFDGVWLAALECSARPTRCGIAGIQPEDPGRASLACRQDKWNRFMVGVEEQDECFVGDGIAPRVFFFDGVAGEDEADGPQVPLVPIGLIHFFTVRVQPDNVFDVGPVDPPPLEETPAPKHRMVLPQGDEPTDERQQ